MAEETLLLVKVSVNVGPFSVWREFIAGKDLKAVIESALLRSTDKVLQDGIRKQLAASLEGREGLPFMVSQSINDGLGADTSLRDLTLRFYKTSLIKD